ncbi:hypothetical protein [Janthinobacterium sp. GW458P]|uniref:hypothetical protein n=1 Tax=Janthinobacterium sp. GW458P TaxID=1981504 RepID=UPI001121A163|nr:hypothetical protein [Janthinobacterium sp. GW458P]MBE3023415.1 hypothetical protein [Janthinobacterium sp. GW458P]
MLSPKKLQYQQINKIITISVVFIDMLLSEIINIFISVGKGVQMRKIDCAGAMQAARAGRAVVVLEEGC